MHDIPTLQVPLQRFGFDAPQSMPGLEATDDPQLAPFLQQVDEDHVFSKNEFIVFRAWWATDGSEPLYLCGPQGSGKTTFVKQLAARLNYPLISINGRSNMERADLIGSYCLRSQGGASTMDFIDGPATRAWRHGLLLLVNEFTACDPAFWVANNDILEGDAIYIEQTGELVRRHPRARIVLTDNTRGIAADDTGAFQGRLRQDASVMDRMWKMQMDYMAEDAEVALLMRDMPEFGTDPTASNEVKQTLAKKLRDIATDVRTAFMGTSMDAAAIEVTMSTRTLMRFRDLLFLFKDAGKAGLDPIKSAMDIALTAVCDPSTRQAIHKIAELKLGSHTPTAATR